MPMVVLAVIVWFPLNKTGPIGGTKRTPTLERTILIHTPKGSNIVADAPVALEDLRSELFQEGKQHTKVTIWYEPDCKFFHGSCVIVEFGPESKLPPTEKPPGVGQGLTLTPFIVPPKAVVEVSADGAPPRDPTNYESRSDYKVHYRLHQWERPFHFPPEHESRPHHIRFVAAVKWSCDISSGSAEYEDEYLVEPVDSNVIRELIQCAELEVELTEAGKKKWGEVKMYAIGGEEKYLEPVRAKHGLSEETKFYHFRRADTDWSIGIDPETGLVFWSYYEI